MRQGGLTLLELVICVGVLGLATSGAMVIWGQSMAKQELEISSLQLAADLRWLQQRSINGGSGTVSYRLLFNNAQPYGYYVTANTQVIRNVNFPLSVGLPGNSEQISFALSGVPRGAQTIGLQSTKLKTWRYVILAPVTGRVRISDSKPQQPEQ